MIRWLKKIFGMVNLFPDVATCPLCRWEMTLVGIEFGYSCHNPNCDMHVDHNGKEDL